MGITIRRITENYRQLRGFTEISLDIALTLGNLDRNLNCVKSLFSNLIQLSVKIYFYKDKFTSLSFLYHYDHQDTCTAIRKTTVGIKINL